MRDLWLIVLSLIACPAWFLLARSVIRAVPPEPLWRAPFDTGPNEPCWTEEISRHGGLVYARSQCVNDALMEMDARTGRGDFPVPSGGG